MSSESFSRHISGEERRNRIEAIAHGEKTLVQLAEESGVTYQVMRDFSSRHSDEIQARKAELQAEVHAESAHLWVSDKVEILRFYQMMLDTLRSKVSASETDDRVQSRAVRNAQKLLHDCSELGGFPQARSKVELEVSNAELPAVGTKWLQVAPDASADDS